MEDLDFEDKFLHSDDTMYRCTECHNYFSKPAHYFMDRGIDHSEEKESCPYCNDGDVAYEEVKLCPLCSINYVPLKNGKLDFCYDCKAKMINHFKEVILNNIDEIEYDYFYEWLEGKSYEDFRKEDK